MSAIMPKILKPHFLKEKDFRDLLRMVAQYGSDYVLKAVNQIDYRIKMKNTGKRFGTKLALLFLLATVGCQKDNDNPGATGAPLSPISSTVLRTLSGVATANAQTDMSVDGFNPDHGDTLSVSVPNGWSRRGVNVCDGTAMDICYTLSGSVVQVINSTAADRSFTIQATLHV